MQILGVKVDNITHDEALAQVLEFFKGGQHVITTPNPEIILAAREDQQFQDTLNKADLALPDGFGLVLMSRLIRSPLKEQICGSDFIWDICALAEKENKSVYLIGSQEGIAAKAAENLREKYPQLRIVGAEIGLRLSIINDQSDALHENQQLITRINTAQPDIIFVAFGHGKQEKWIADNLSKLPSVKIAMGIGGSLDFVADVVPRAPLWMRQIGCEWLWRLIQEPRRWRRIYNAVIKFPIAVMLEKIAKK